MQITKDFSEKELNCRCGTCNARINLFFAVKLQLLRDACGFALPISSGARCKEHNTKEGGASDSRHLYGEAVDIYWSGLTGFQKLTLLSKINSLGFGGVGIGSSILHVDTRPIESPLVWFYNDK